LGKTEKLTIVNLTRLTDASRLFFDQGRTHWESKMFEQQPTQARNFSRLGVQYQILPFYDRDPATTEVQGYFSDDLIAQALAIFEEYWRIYLDVGFQDFGIVRSGRRVYEVVFDSSMGIPGRANDVRASLRGSDLRDANDASASNEDRLLRLTHFRNTIAHELFHAVNIAVEDPFESQNAFREGAADAAAFLLRTPAEREILGLGSYREYLRNTAATMWDRTSPGVGNPYDTQSAPTLWWLYFADQLGRRTQMPGAKLDAFRDMLRLGWDRAGTLEAAYTTRRYHGNFLGNRERQFLFDSDNPGRRLALVSANESHGGSGAMHLRRRNNERFGPGGWRVRSADRVVAVGDIVGNGRDQFIIQSQRPMYIGVLGYSQADGAPFSSSMITYAAVPVEGRWGGWKLRDGDQIHLTGQFSSAARDFFAITSVRGSESAHLGLLGLGDDGQVQTLATLREGSTVGTQGWEFRSSDHLVTSGNLLGNGRDQIVIQNSARNAIGIIGLDERDSWVTYAVVEENERFGSGWRLKSQDQIAGIGAFSSVDRSQLALVSRERNLGIVGFDDAGNLSTGPVTSLGKELGDTGWVWQATDQIAGVGHFSLNGLAHLVVRQDKEIGMIGVDGSGKFVTYDSTIATEIDGLAEVWGIGDFAGLGKDQIFGVTSTDGRSTAYLSTLSVEEPLDPKLRNGRFTLHAENGVFTNTLFYLAQYIRERGDPRSFPAMWRDFTVANLAKELTDQPEEFRYSMSLPIQWPTLTDYPTSRDRLAIKRWASHYFRIASVNSASSIRVQGRVTSAPFRIYWTVVVADASNKFLYALKEHGNAMNFSVAANPGDKIFLIVTTTYAGVDIEIGN